MTGHPNFDQKKQSVQNQTNIDKAEQVIIQSPGSAAAPLVPPQQIRRPPVDFTGREDEIKEIIEKFDNGESVIGVRGLGGIGKTALALVLGNRLKDRFPDGQLFLNMQGMSKSPLKPEDAMAHIIRSYRGTDVSLPLDFNGLAGLYNSVLSEKKSLILLDNVSGRDQIEPLLPPAGSVLLVTSRDKFALTGLKETDLGVLPLDDSKKLLLEIADRIGKHAEDLANLCGCLPLALRNAAYALAEKKNLNVADYVKRLKDARKQLDLVEASFSLSYELLTPKLQMLWSLLSVFPADFDLAGAAAVWEMEQAPAEEALGELVKWSLVDFFPSAVGEGGRYRLHDLARVFAGSRFDAVACDSAQHRYAEHYRSVLSIANELYKQGKETFFDGLDLFDQEWANIKVGQTWAEKNAKLNVDAATLCSAYPDAGFYLLGLRRHPMEQIHWLQHALTASQQLKDRKSEGRHLGRIGRYYAHLGEIRRALDYYEQAIVIAREVGDRDVEGWALDNMGSAFRKLGNTSKAISYCRQHLKIAREIGDKRGEGTALGNIGQAYRLVGEISKAIEYHKQHLMIVKKEGNKRGERDALGNLGNAYVSRGDYRMAIDYYEKALAISEEMRDSRGNGDVLANMGRAYIALGKPKMAIDFCMQALKASREIGDRHREGHALYTMALGLAELGQREKAIDSAKEALEIYEKIESLHVESVRQQLVRWQS